MSPLAICCGTTKSSLTQLILYLNYIINKIKMVKTMAKTEAQKGDKKNKKESDNNPEVVEEIKEKIKQWCPKQLFVSGLPYTTTEEELKQFFKD